MIDIENLAVTYNPGQAMEKRIFQGLNLHVEEGEFVCILGSNGVGKSTLFNAILGNIPYKGNVLVNGELLNGKKPYKRAHKVAVVYQDPLKGTAPHLSVAENLICFGYKGGGKKKFLSRCKEELAHYEVGLENAFRTLVRDLSGGMRQALTLYMATLCNPKVLLLDEHIAALDPKASARLMEITARLQKEKNLTTLMIIHNLKMALQYGSRLLVLNTDGIALDIAGEKKKGLTEEEVLSSYGNALSDRTLFQND